MQNTVSRRTFRCHEENQSADQRISAWRDWQLRTDHLQHHIQLLMTVTRITLAKRYSCRQVMWFVGRGAIPLQSTNIFIYKYISRNVFL